MANENALLVLSETDNEDSFDFDDLESELQNNLDSQLSELEFLKEDREKIGNLDNLGNTIMNVVWEQCINQIAVTAGEDFIRENRGLTLDLRNSAHIQTTENFEAGKIATHNDKIDFQKRHDDWQNNFQKNDDGSNKTNKDNPQYKGDKPNQKVLKKDARDPFDKGRPTGSTAVHKDDTIPVAEIIRDPAANAHLDKQEQIDFARSDKNLKDLDASANMSKSDTPMNEWLDSERDGNKPAERFNIDEEELRERDRIAREEFEKLKEEGERESIETGKQSQKDEARRIGGQALRAVLMGLLAALVKEIISKLIKWMKSAKKNLDSFIDSIKKAINSFVRQLKKHLINAGNAILTTIATAILGPIVGLIKKIWIMLKQGWQSLKEAIIYLKDPSNKGKPYGMLILEVGKIVIAGLTVMGAVAFSGIIENALMLTPAAPIFAFPIPILGSLGSILGLFLGGLVAGIIGAIAMNLIDKAVAKQQENESIKNEIKKGNEILNTQSKLTIVNKKIVNNTKIKAASNIAKRHKELVKTTNEAIDVIYNKNTSKEIIVSENENEFIEMNKILESVQT